MMKGLAVGKGIAIGRVQLIQRDECVVSRTTVEDCEREQESFDGALANALLVLERERIKSSGEQEEILEAHEMMLSDPDMGAGIRNKIHSERKSASWAVEDVLDEYVAMFESMDDEYMRARAADCADIKMRLLAALEDGEKDDFNILWDDTILVSEDIYPSELIGATGHGDGGKLIGFITEQGSETSHISILARNMGLAAIVCARGVLSRVENGDVIIIDGNTGEYYVNPSRETMKKYSSLKDDENSEVDRLRKMIGLETRTKAGRHVSLHANIGSVEEAGVALRSDADGVGLFRTEFLFMDRDSMPEEDEQYEIYKSVAEIFAGRDVVIRTLDAGGDKNIGYLNIKKEDNPFMGYRAIRICLNEPEIFKTQLRAIVRANTRGNLKIMFPMICTLDELRTAKSILGEVIAQVKNHGEDIPDRMDTGIMIETPASVMIADRLAEECDFFSIGTNDLIQYTMACDRTNPIVNYLYNPMEESILRMIEATIKAGHSRGIPVSLCGEAGSHPPMVEKLLDYGIDKISMPAPMILSTRAFIRGLD